MAITIAHVIIVLAWWIVGTASMLWLCRAADLTWGQLIFCLIAGLIGPPMWVLIAFVVLCQADFWGKPIFPKKDRREQPFD